MGHMGTPGKMLGPEEAEWARAPIPFSLLSSASRKRPTVTPLHHRNSKMEYLHFKKQKISGNKHMISEWSTL